MNRQASFLLWRALALIALGTGLVGIALPVLPTVPLLILAAWAGGKGWPALENWLLKHPRYGPHIRAWRKRGAISRKAKLLAILAMTASAAILQFTIAPLWLRITIPALMLFLVIWLWRRPEE